MATCFVFIKSLTDDSFLSVSLDQNQQVVQPLAKRKAEELRQIQTNNRTCIVVSGEHFAFHRLELPWLGEKKARIAIPYALEDKFAENVDELHFAFNRQYYQQGQYLIAACKKEFLQQLLLLLKDNDIHLDILTVDWFALENKEICVAEDSLIIHDETFCGVLNPPLTDLFLKKASPEHRLFLFKESMALPEHLVAQIIHEENLYLWLAKRLLVGHPMNMAQGQFLASSETKGKKRWIAAAVAMAVLWLFSNLSGTIWQNYRLNQQIEETDKQIAVIYKQFFPQAQQVISPRFRIEQLLKTKGNDSENPFWVLLNQLSKTLDSTDVAVEQLRYQNHILQVTVIGKDFASVEKVENQLQKLNVKVKQTQASTREQQVASTLELSL
ncbi:general secretion pathway protein L [Legionella quinlivanii]|uniref:Type II secretion system protein L n=1 Tax=Legionella quinlivanii TaxID=45073 RepID=A0A0W0XL60_9GAMM|nr:type II secretion system protein GspL [Legionella quinlivanii]KTD45351.1 general secretion pathway protein L [Legionella quinlivanii]MCW8451404.1 type II secretion system protein GspL [Legionella quinlivanii]SEG15282.1 general secretion pathway protein L [Legionella quinlivanii DSM 21216]STY10393.1 general secretion pathway protein L [Legionella quinlivanii]